MTALIPTQGCTVVGPAKNPARAGSHRVDHFVVESRIDGGANLRFGRSGEATLLNMPARSSFSVCVALLGALNDLAPYDAADLDAVDELVKVLRARKGL